MKRPRFRFTIRRMMIVVAVVATALGIFMGLRARTVRFRRTAAFHALWSRNEFDTAWGFSGYDTRPDGSPQEASTKMAPLPVRNRAQHRKLAAEFWDRHLRHEAIREKYERAARYPWLPVAPDPPEPD